MVAMNDIVDFAGEIAQRFHPERIVLYGSYAYGQPTPDSDVDLLVVMPYQGKSWRAATEIRTRTRPTFPVDLMVRSPEELGERIRLGDFFLKEIAERGKVLYEADHG
jgi:predicted nucleotidyltransferase